MNDDRLARLVSGYLDGQLTPDERSELEDLLRRSATARAQFWRDSRLHALLHEVENVGGPAAAECRGRLPRRRFGSAAALLTGAAGIALLVALGVHYWPRPLRATVPAGAAHETTTTAVAVLTRTLNAQWSTPADTHTVGAALDPGWLRLRAGIAYLEFFNGVGMVVEGPAELQLISAREAFCRAGRLRADVPPVARGFTVRTPQFQVVDRGTAFGLYAADGRAEVHVFKGKVTLQVAAAQPRDLSGGEALAVAPDGTLQRIPSNQAAFLSAADVERQSAMLQGQQVQAWRDAAARLNADPSLILRFDFEQDARTERALHNLAEHRPPAGDATIVGCASAAGRWPGKGALEFRNLSDRVRVSVPGIYRSLSMVAWVRVDRLECLFNSLFMTDAFEPGAVHWQIRRNGSLHLAIAGPGNESAVDYNYDSPGVFDAARLGCWTQVAMVYDSTKRQMTQYVDGQPVGRSPIARVIPLRISHGELGNWNQGNSSDPVPIRYLSGRMDEFALFDRALNDQEILDLYTMGSAGPAQR